jgi:hypothetical protein
VYTKYNDFGEPSLAQAIFDGENWNPELLVGGENRITPEGSKDIDAARPRVAYFGFNRGSAVQRRLAVRLVDFPSSERVVPNLYTDGSRLTFDGTSFVPNEPALLSTAVVPSGLRQIFYYDFQQNDLRQITFNNSYKLQSPETWSSPEFGGETLFIIAERSRPPGGEMEALARVYGRARDSEDWIVYTAIRSPDPEKPYVAAPYPFVYDGATYVSFRTQRWAGSDQAADIWVVNLSVDPQDRVFRMVSTPGNGRRYDHEVFIIDTGPVVYYTEQPPDGRQRVRRCLSGIGPLQQASLD